MIKQQGPWTQAKAILGFYSAFCMVAVAVIGNSPQPLFILVFLFGEWEERFELLVLGKFGLL